MALPATLNPARPAGNDATNDPASTIDNQIRDLKQLIADLFGIPVDPTSLTAAIMSVTAAGLISNATLGTAAPATPVANRLYTDSIVKGWVRADGATWTIQDALNVSSITDNGTGDFTINWARAFANANYAVIGIVREAGLAAANIPHAVRQASGTAPTTTAVRCNTTAQDSTAGSEFQLVLADPVGVYVLAIGDM